jgi:hypothetical protein
VAATKSTAEGYIDSAVFGNIDYLHVMLDCLFDIGGPEWDIQTAAAAKADVRKFGAAISAPRMRSLTEIRSRLTEATKMLEKFFGDLDTTEKVETTVAATIAPVIAPVTAIAPVIAPVIAPTVEDPAAAALLATVSVQMSAMDRLLATVAAQAIDINKARANVRSNALTGEARITDNGVVWDRDMATSQSRARSR